MLRVDLRFHTVFTAIQNDIYIAIEYIYPFSGQLKHNQTKKFFAPC